MSGLMGVKVIECPRDAMQGWHQFISTQDKIDYINLLLKVGFDTIDFGSFVSPKAIPQLRDTAEVLAGLDLTDTRSKLLAIIANTRGAESAVKNQEITYLGFPFSISETFQQRNTNSSIADSFVTVNQIQELCVRNNKQLVVYISMGFGNPYGDEWDEDIVAHWTEQLVSSGVNIISLSDTVGVSNPENITYLFKHLIPAFPQVEFGAHLHTRPDNWEEKLVAAYEHGCRRFDGAIKGFGGCPMADDDLVGNMATENILSFLAAKQAAPIVNMKNFNAAMHLSGSIFI